MNRERGGKAVNQNFIRYLALAILVPLVEVGIIILLGKAIGFTAVFTLLIVSTLIGYVWEWVIWKQCHQKLSALMRSKSREFQQLKDMKDAGASDEEIKAEFAQDGETLPQLMAIAKGSGAFFLAFFLFFIPGFVTDGIGYWVLYSKVTKPLAGA